MADRMSDVEALMWTLEKDPHLSSTFANLTVLDRSPDLEAFRRRLHRATTKIPRLRQRVVSGLGRLAPPEWQAADVDLGWHVRRVALPAVVAHRQVGPVLVGGRAEDQHRAATGATLGFDAQRSTAP